MLIDETELTQEEGALTPAALRESREVRESVIAKYGFIPSSILHHKRSDKPIDLSKIEDGRSYTGQERYHIETNTENEVLRELSIYKRRGSGARFGALSSISQNVGRCLIDIYCPKDGTVYSPFCGHGGDLCMTFYSDRHFIGVDVAEKFIEQNKRIADMLVTERNYGLLPGAKDIRLYCGSSASVPAIPDGSADFTITSPPYWCLEDYGPEAEQLGKALTYEQFLENLYPCVTENYRILKPGAFCSWFVNDFRLGGKFYPYHIDVFALFIKAGFIPFNIYIVDLGASFLEAFVQKTLQTKIFPKRHEYCLLFTKEK